jgi:putative flippase GtrA
VLLKERCHPYRRLFLAPSFFRFVIVGFSNFVIGYLLFISMLAVFSQVPFSASISQLISYSGGIAWSFLLNRKWTFKSNGYFGTHAVRFVTLQLGLAATSAALISLVSDVIGYNPKIAWFGVMAVITIINYALSKTWAFAD